MKKNFSHAMTSSAGLGDARRPLRRWIGVLLLAIQLFFLLRYCFSSPVHVVPAGIGGDRSAMQAKEKASAEALEKTEEAKKGVLSPVGGHRASHVCLESADPMTLSYALQGVNRSDFVVTVRSRIVIFNALKNTVPPRRAEDDPTGDFLLEYRTGMPPARFRQSSQVLQIRRSTCEGNFWHFLTEMFAPVVQNLKEVDLLPSAPLPESAPPRCMVFFPTPFRSFDRTDGCHSDRFEPFVRAVGCEWKFYADTPLETCYERALLGGSGSVSLALETLDRVIERGTESKCSSDGVTILQRSRRRFLNIPELEQAARDANINVRVVDFEQMSATDQFLTARCTRVLVGVHGAGLAWLYALKPPGGLIEFQWSGWEPFAYSEKAREVGLQSRLLKIPPQGVEIDWDVFSRLNACPMNEVQRKAGNFSHCPKAFGPEKYANVRVDPKVFVENVQRMLAIAKR